MHDFIVQMVTEFGYLAIFLLMAAESACIPIPSEVIMLFGGAFATAAVGGETHLDLVTVAMAGACGNLVGSWAAYALGRVGGRPLVDRWGRLVFIRPHELDRAEAWFSDHGPKAVFVSRLMPVVRTFISVPAGAAQMPLPSFTIYTFLGCLPWTFALAAIGYALGTRWASASHVLGPIGIAVAVTLAIGGVWWVVLQRRRGRDAHPER